MPSIRKRGGGGVFQIPAHKSSLLFHVSDTNPGDAKLSFTKQRSKACFCLIRKFFVLQVQLFSPDIEAPRGSLLLFTEITWLCTSSDVPFDFIIFGSVTLWCESGSSDPYLWLTNLAPDPALFRQWPSRRQQKKTFFLSFGAYSSKIKIQKEVTK